MILTIIGLSLSFIGSILLLIFNLMNWGKPPSSIAVGGVIGGDYKDIIRLERQKDGFGKRVKITKEEIKMIISLSLLGLGFLFQIIDILIS